MRMQTTIELPEELLERARGQAMAEGRTLASLVEDGLRRLLTDRPPSGGICVVPPISTAGGGMQGAVSIERFSDVQALDDLDYVRRMYRTE